STFDRVQRSSRTVNSPMTRSGVMLTMDTPISLAKGRGSSGMALLGRAERKGSGSSAVARRTINNLAGCLGDFVPLRESKQMSRAKALLECLPSESLVSTGFFLSSRRLRGVRAVGLSPSQDL